MSNFNNSGRDNQQPAGQSPTRIPRLKDRERNNEGSITTIAVPRGPSTPLHTELQATEWALAEKQRPTTIVTINDPFRTSRSCNQQLAHTNMGNEHRYKRTGQGRRARPPMDVNRYIAECKRLRMFDGLRYEVMDDVPTGTGRGLPEKRSGRDSRQQSWAKKWAHMGANALTSIAVQPADTIWVRCPEEVQYQARAVELIDLLRHRTESWRTFEEVPSILPRPLPNWYMFKDREYWEEDALFEARMRRRTKVGARSRTGSNNNAVIPVMLGWHDVGSFGILV